MRERFYVIETRGYSISKSRVNKTEQSSFAVLDRFDCHREVATFPAVRGGGGGDYPRKMNAQTRCAELNAWANARAG